jgi:hypothetical protein
VLVSAALVTGILVPVAAMIITLPTRIANWTIRSQDLEVERQRGQHELQAGLEELTAKEKDEIVKMYGHGTRAVIHGSPQAYQEKRLRADYQRQRKALMSEAKRREMAIDQELDANWWTHMFASRCQGGPQPSLPDVLPRRRNAPPESAT